METEHIEEMSPAGMTEGMTLRDYEMAIEAILFAAGHPVTYEQLAKTFELPVSEIEQIVYAYADKYNSVEPARGVSLITFDSCCQLCTKPEYISLIRSALGIRKTAGTLSPSTIEALTIVAYQQPVTRAYVDAVRNADSTYAMTNLLDRGLIEPKGRKDAPGRPILYGTTNAFLLAFGLSSLDDLPGNEGGAKGIFRSIDHRLKLDEEGEQITIDELMNGILPEEEPVVSQEKAEPEVAREIPDDTDDASDDNATEEAERNSTDI